ncbi:MAG: hypothetical protein AAGH40_11145 [Verrucomicrobiota bacterium]
MDDNVGPDWIIILGQPVPRATVRNFIIAGIVFLLIMGAVAFYVVQETLWRPVDVSEETKSDTQEIAEPFVPVILNPLEKLLLRHIEATQFNDLTSLRVRGIYKSNDIEMEMLLQARSPDLYRQTLNYNNVEVDVGMVQGNLWVEQTHPVIDLDDKKLGEINNAVLRMESSIPSLAWRHDGGLAKLFLELGPNVIEDGKEYSIIYNRSYSGIEIVHFIEKETALEKKRTTTITADDEDVTIEIVYTGISTETKYNFPSGYEVLLNDELFYEVEFDSFEFNIGLASFLFEPR